MNWPIWSHVPRQQENHLLFTICGERPVPRKYLKMPERVRNQILSEAENITSIVTIASEYTSDSYVGRADLTLSRSFGFVENEQSSGAFQHIQPLLCSVEALNDRLFLVIDESLKSVRRGFPLSSIRTFVCVLGSVRQKMEGEIECLRFLDSREPLRWSVSN